MATLISSIITDARVELKETVASYWTDAELLAHFKKGVNELWGAIIDLNQEHFLTVDITNVSLAANSNSLTGVPADVFRVHLIEPLDTTSSGATPDVLFWPRDYNSSAFRNARQLTAQDPTGGLDIFYTLSQAGSPVAAPTVHTAPQVSSAVALRFVYVPGPASASLTTASNNPIGGESDNALMAWMIAYARAKEREDRSPDPNWLAIYATEKQNLLVRMAPRQTQEPEVVEDVFGGFM
jgi:hypothetical protein